MSIIIPTSQPCKLCINSTVIPHCRLLFQQVNLLSHASIKGATQSTRSHTVIQSNIWGPIVTRAPCVTNKHSTLSQSCKLGINSTVIPYCRLLFQHPVRDKRTLNSHTVDYQFQHISGCMWMVLLGTLRDCVITHQPSLSLAGWLFLFSLLVLGFILV